MKKLSALFFCLVSVGCVHKYDVQTSRNGLPVSRTHGEVGYRSSWSQTETHDTLMPTCVSHVGQMPGNEEIPLCAEKTRATVIQETYPYGYYGYGGYGYGTSAPTAPSQE
ncbi:hypothetical protein KJ781_00075 [Patescibacteria group bacterium]|nr:hypothetical protein [Patescibacteria group bacterium]MBU1448582.1 hypothetical protein [Patescibacteria group bacterium]MBU2613437.1 hypothetical protein [Patescibacteria group bacterium]